MGERGFDIACMGVMLVAMAYADWSARASHRRTVEAYERTIQFFRELAAGDDQEAAAALSNTEEG